MSKKKRRNCLFDLDEVKKRFDEEKSCADSVKQQVIGLQKFDLVDIFETKSLSFTEDETLQLLAAKLTFQGVCNLRKTIHQVPSNIRRVISGKPLRATLMWDTFNALCSLTNCHVLRPTSVDELSRYAEIMESRCPSFLSVNETQLQSHVGPTVYISPPLSSCLKCDKLLSMHNKPSTATLFTLNGPTLCGKVNLECKNCNVRYGIVSFSDEAGVHLYPTKIDANKSLVEVSNVTYFDKSLYRWIPSLSNHCWVSFSGFAEAYNETYEQQIIQYASRLKSCSTSVEQAEEAPEDCSIGILTGELSAKLVAKCFWHCEVEEELKERGLREKWIFAPNQSGTNEHIGTYDDVMEYVDRNRCEELYSHKCSSHCKQKGCGKLYVADGNWKLRYPHCMWKVPVSVSGFGKINYPSICPLSPKRGHAFCNEHSEKAQAMGYETGLRDLYKKCGVTGVEVDQALDEMSSKPLLSDSSFDAVSGCLDGFVDQSNNNNIPNASTFQGTTDFLLNNPAFVEDNSVESDLKCNKDTGGLKTLHFWSRGVFFIVSAGGHIEYWQPLYKSESPTQAFLITILWLYRKFKALEDAGYCRDEIKSEISSTVLSYDNMCHMDGLLIAKKNLPLPYPYDEMWKRVGKVIDRLHLKNHVDPKCKRLYNPDDKLPQEFNTMACEQTFVWASRFKKVMCAMPHIHQFFFLHRIVKYRNKYTEKCHINSKIPILPKLAKM